MAAIHGEGMQMFQMIALKFSANCLFLWILPFSIAFFYGFRVEL
jgi:hypothetical protein